MKKINVKLDKTTRDLVLKRTTLRALTSGDLANIAAGKPTGRHDSEVGEDDCTVRTQP